MRWVKGWTCIIEINTVWGPPRFTSGGPKFQMAARASFWNPSVHFREKNYKTSISEHRTTLTNKCGLFCLLSLRGKMRFALKLQSRRLVLQQLASLQYKVRLVRANAGVGPVGWVHVCSAILMQQPFHFGRRTVLIHILPSYHPKFVVLVSDYWFFVLIRLRSTRCHILCACNLLYIGAFGVLLIARFAKRVGPNGMACGGVVSCKQRKAAFPKPSVDFACVVS